MWSNKLFRWWNTKRKCALCVHSLYNYWFENENVMRMEKKNYSQVYLEECKYKIKEIKTSEFINAEWELDSGSNSE